MIGVAVLAASCASPKPTVTDREDLLAAAGFTSRKADTAQRQSLLATLPAQQIVQRHRDGMVVYVYADPSVCDCLYIGDEPAFGRYQRDIQDRGLQDETQAPVMMDEGPTWSWGAW